MLWHKNEILEVLLHDCMIQNTAGSWILIFVTLDLKQPPVYPKKYIFSLRKGYNSIGLLESINLKSMFVGGAVAEWSKALLVRENKRKSKRSQVRPPTWAPFKKKKKIYSVSKTVRFLFSLVLLDMRYYFKISWKYVKG